MPSDSPTYVSFFIIGIFGNMREGAMLLSEKDYPLFVGDFQPGFAGSLVTKVKLGNVVDFSLVPAWIYQSGAIDSHAAVQIPMSLILELGEVVQTSADLGVHRRQIFLQRCRWRAHCRGRLADAQDRAILAHAGAGVASLLTGGMYPTISDWSTST